MELLVENWAEREMTAYESERGKPMPSFNHSYVQNNLLFELNTHFRKQFSFMPELTLEMPARPNCVPDISVFHKMKANFLHDEITFSEKPFIAIEIVSPTQSNDEILLKFERYFLAGIQSCWLVMPSLKAISVYSKIGEYVFFNNNDTLVDTATDIQLNLGEVFS